MRTKLKMIFCYLISAAFAVSACLYPTASWSRGVAFGESGSDFIQRFDQDGDGLVSAEEFLADSNLFNRLDADGDGYLNAAEAPAPPDRANPAGPGEKDIMTFDSDADGMLSHIEFPGPEDLFEGLDEDGDGYLTLAELEAGRPEAPPPGFGYETDDADQDGRISENEFTGPADLFDRMDKNGDGYISPEEAMLRKP